MFELIDASTIHEMMKDIFNHGVGMNNTFLVDPFSLRVQLGFRNSYDMTIDEYKYRVAVVADKIRLNINPKILVDVMYFNQFLEGQSYL